MEQPKVTIDSDTNSTSSGGVAPHTFQVSDGYRHYRVWLLFAIYVAIVLTLAACSKSAGSNAGGAGDHSAGAHAGNAGTANGGHSGKDAGSGGTRSTGGSPGTGGKAPSAATGGSTSAGGAPSTGGAGGTGSAGHGGSAGGVAGSSAGDGAVACAQANVCDDFESYKAGAGFGVWKQQGTSGSLTAEDTHVFSGSQAVHFHIDAGANKRVQLERTGSPLFPVANNAFWGRVMVWASDLPGMSDTENKNVHYDVIQASGAQPGEYRIAGMGHVLLNYQPHDCYSNTDKLIPETRWACWEWLYDGSRNVIEFYIDGALQARIESKGQGCVDGTDSVWSAPTFNALRMGFINYQSKPATTDLWMDDFAAGPERIGCPAMRSNSH